MRVLHVLDHSIPLHSGYTFRTLAILREQRALGWETCHLTSPKHHVAQADEEDIDGWHFHRTRMQDPALARVPGAREFRLMSRMEARIGEIIARERPDIIHAHSPVLNAIPALRAGRRFGIPVIYEVRAFWEDAAVDHGTGREGGLRYRLTRGLETHALKRAAHVTTICEGLRREIVGRGIPAERVTVIPNAVDVAGFRFDEPPDEALRAKLGLAGATVIGFLGSFYAYEGLDLLVQALPLLLREVPDARVLLVGGGPHEAVIRQAAVRLGVEDKVVFAGRVPHAEVHRYYGIVDVLAYPRRPMRLTELVTPLKPLEAMAQGRLLVASDVGGHRELIRDGETGMLFRAGSAESLAAVLADLLRRRSEWPRLKAAGRRFVEAERTWAGSVARYRPVFEVLAGRGSGDRGQGTGFVGAGEAGCERAPVR
ncbi:MAG: glycosyltransferase, exosortase A system-associated [Rhodocyclales bacterium CG_4_9_14_3_um_filter_68_10]|nr:MAG: glycosyltransferase, exosortase A system-associated [Rhodocyclales bacterium CG_4_9_14_3_um_filter_68_10]